MSENQSNSLDFFGIKPVADAINKATTAAVDGAGAFLSRICLPAAEEYGLLLRDLVSHWRATNLAAITRRAEEKLASSDAPENVHAHPRLVKNIIEEGSWIEDPVVQDYWAGLLASSCTEDGDDDSNMIFVNLLASLTKLQARVVNHACKNAQKILLPNGLIGANYLHVSLESLTSITYERDIQRLDRELDHLRELGLIHFEGGFDHHRLANADITPSSLALHLYVRCQGSRSSPVDFFQVNPDGGTQTPDLHDSPKMQSTPS